MHLSTSLSSALLAYCCAGAAIFPTASPQIIHERSLLENTTPQKHRGQRMQSSALTTFHVFLQQPNLSHAHATLLNISSPSSPAYGKFWTPERVRETFAPQPEAVEVVRAWLLDELGVENVVGVGRRGGLMFETSVGQMEELLGAEYFEHDIDGGEVRIGCDRYHLPQHISQHVDYITPGVALSAPLHKRKVAKRDVSPSRGASRPAPWWHSQPYHLPPGAAQIPLDLQTCGRNITPACIRALYDIPTQPPSPALGNASNTENALGVFEDDNYYNQTDLDLFFAAYAPNVPNGTHPTLASIEGATVDQSSPTRDESLVDLDIVYSLIYPQTVVLYQSSERYGTTNQTAAGLQNGLFGLSVAIENFLDAFDGAYCTAAERANGTDCGIYQPARVTSISYGTAEIMFSPALLQRQCNEFMKLSLLGHTFVVSSGDYGVAATPNIGSGPAVNGCIAPGNISASTAQLVNGTVFNPGYPASCPYVLSVGGTQLNDNDTVYDAESAMNVPALLEQYGIVTTPGEVPLGSFSSAGGFSNVFARPGYQAEAVEGYFVQHDPGYATYTLDSTGGKDDVVGASGGLYNRGGRGIPDVSANGANFMDYIGGVVSPAYGTSLAAPIWASILTLVNEERTAVGKGPVGFVNPTLYQNPDIFHDVTNGTNPGCGTYGFAAVEGWDPITGLGTPDYPKLLEVFMKLP